MKGILQDHLSTALMDIRRLSSITGNIEEIFSNIPVHMTRKSLDNPDPTAISTVPVIVTATLHMEKDIDIRNNDIVIVKILNETGTEIDDAWRGIAGNPWTVNSRKRVSMTMQQLGRDSIIDSVTPPQDIIPEGKSTITIKFLDDMAATVRSSITTTAKIGEPLEIEALLIHGWDFLQMEFNGAVYNIDKLEFTPMDSEYEVIFVYEKLLIPTHFKVLQSSRFQRDDGTFATGAHWYALIPLRLRHADGDFMQFLIPTDRITHIESRNMIQFYPRMNGARLLIMPQEYFAEIISTTQEPDGFLINAAKVIPTTAESAAYITTRYDEIYAFEGW